MNLGPGLCVKVHTMLAPTKRSMPLLVVTAPLLLVPLLPAAPALTSSGLDQVSRPSPGFGFPEQVRRWKPEIPNFAGHARLIFTVAEGKFILDRSRSNLPNFFTQWKR